VLLEADVVTPELPPVPEVVVVVVAGVVVVVVGVVVVEVVVGVVVVVVVVGVVVVGVVVVVVVVGVVVVSVVVVVVVVGVVVVVVVVGVVVVVVEVVVVEPPVAAQVLERTKKGSPPSPAVASGSPPVIVAVASRSVAPLGSLITAPLPLCMKPELMVTGSSKPFTSKYAVTLLKVAPWLCGRMKWKPSVVVLGWPSGSKSQLCNPVNVVAVTPSKPAPSWRQATLGGALVQSGALAVAETLVTARTPHTETLAPATARLAPKFRRTRQLRLGRRNLLILNNFSYSLVPFPCPLSSSFLPGQVPAMLAPRFSLEKGSLHLITSPGLITCENMSVASG
jgi:hypothetical protein